MLRAEVLKEYKLNKLNEMSSLIIIKKREED